MADYETVGLLARAIDQLAGSRPLIPMYIHLILSALFPIYTGAHASLSRPSSAAKPAKNRNSSNDDEVEEDDEEVVQKMEGLGPQDAVIFPVTAALVLGGLYYLITRYGAELINFIMSWYFSGVGLFSVAKLINDGTSMLMTLLFPAWYWHGGTLWRASEKRQKMVAFGKEPEAPQTKESPLPSIPWLSGRYSQMAWKLRSHIKQKYLLEAYIHSVLDVRVQTNIVSIVSAAIGAGLIAYANLVACAWWLTNLQGFAVSYSALQFMSPTTFATGSLILGGLFFYDIWAVFFTPLMVTVAKNLDQPIKLMFPRPEETIDGEIVQTYSMLGLGDIVLPGIMIGLALRYDLHMFYLRQHQRRETQSKQTTSKVTSKPEEGGREEDRKISYVATTSRWGDRLWTLRASNSKLPSEITAATFPKPYFTASLIGYIVGMLATLGVMSVFQHAQPALLYLVPGVVISLWGTALVRGELKEMWQFTEAVTGEPVDDASSSKEEPSKEQSKADGAGLTDWFKGLFWSKQPTKHVDSKEDATKSNDTDKRPGKSSNDLESPEQQKAVQERPDDSKGADEGVMISFSLKRAGPRAVKSGIRSPEGGKLSNGVDGLTDACSS